MDREMTAHQKRLLCALNGRLSREYAASLLFFGGLWGLCEATLGDALYTAGVRHASIPLTVIGFVILTVARAYFPQMGTATLIASCAMLYKFLNAPFFACHLLGILLMGMCYDIFFNVLRTKRTWLAAGLATYSSYAAFAVMITYVARYEHWTRGGLSKVFGHIGIDGSAAAIACAVLVPLTIRLSGGLRRIAPAPFVRPGAAIPWGVTGLTAGLWVLGTAMYIFGHGPVG